MNPIVLQKIAQGAKVIFTNKIVLMIILGLLIWLFLKKGIRKVVRKIRENQFDKNETQNPNILAQQYRSAANPSGNKWMIDWDGTDEDGIDRLAYQTRGRLESVTDAYNQKFGETLTDRMRTELSNDDFQNWRNIVT
jgi:hypothetical protein